MNNKHDIRKKYLSIRAAIDDATQKVASDTICQHIQTLNAYQTAQHIGFYHAVGKEVCLKPLQLNAELEHKHTYLPVIQPQGTLLFIKYQNQDPLVQNLFCIQEPIAAHQKPFPMEELDLLLVPLVAFDNHGTRLGRGKAYYDKTLLIAKPKKLIGVAYACQSYPDILPRNEWDIPLDAIVTENAVQWFN